MVNMGFIFKQEVQYSDRGLVIITTITSGGVYKAAHTIPYQELEVVADVKALTAHVERIEARKLFDAVLEKHRGR